MRIIISHAEPELSFESRIAVDASTETAGKRDGGTARLRGGNKDAGLKYPVPCHAVQTRRPGRSTSKGAVKARQLPIQALITGIVMIFFVMMSQMMMRRRIQLVVR